LAEEREKKPAGQKNPQYAETGKMKNPRRGSFFAKRGETVIGKQVHKKREGMGFPHGP